MGNIVHISLIRKQRFRKGTKAASLVGCFLSPHSCDNVASIPVICNTILWSRNGSPEVPQGKRWCNRWADNAPATPPGINLNSHQKNIEPHCSECPILILSIPTPQAWPDRGAVAPLPTSHFICLFIEQTFVNPYVRQAMLSKEI